MMNPAIEALVHKVAPPAHPLDVGHSWADAETRLGIRFPSDYKTIVSKYGHGYFDPLELAVWNLHVVVPDVAHWIMMEQYSRSVSDDSLYLPSLAKSPGIFPWGHGIQSVLYWVQSGAPDEWHVLVSTDEHTKFHEFEQFNTSQFLFELIVAENQNVTEIWSSDCFCRPQRFRAPDDHVEGVLRHVP